MSCNFVVLSLLVCMSTYTSFSGDVNEGTEDCTQHVRMKFTSYLLTVSSVGFRITVLKIIFLYNSFQQTCTQNEPVYF